MDIQGYNSLGRKQWVLKFLCKLEGLVDEGLGVRELDVLVVLVRVLDALWRPMCCQTIALVRIARCICCGKGCRLMVLLDHSVLVLREFLAVDIGAVDDLGCCGRCV